MKKFILNLITIISWIIEIFMWFSIAVCTLMAGSFVFLLVKMPDVIREIAKEPGLRQYSSQFWRILPSFMIIGLIAVIFFNLGIHNVRHLIKNIKQEVYFDQANLHELKQLLIRSLFIQCCQLFPGQLSCQWTAHHFILMHILLIWYLLRLSMLST